MDKLKKYARLLIETGLNIAPKQRVLISSPVDCAPFARMCADCAYDAGAAEVTMLWRDDYLTRQKYLRGADEIFDECPEWFSLLYNSSAQKGVSFLSISANDPESLKGVDPERLKRTQRANGEAIAPFRKLQASNGFAWCIGALPVPSWAKKVFPDCGEQEAMDKLLDAILTAVRITDDNDPVKAWEEHLDNLTAKRAVLNGHNFKSLHYKNSLGTDLVVELPERHVWQGGGDRGVDGRMFIANMPTEETFTLPHKNGVNGVVCSSMPLVLNGNIVNKFKLTFESGKCVDACAEQGEEFLKAALALDEGASRLGEVALVQYDSPISNSGILFYNTLFDENASCHFALGSAYPCFEDAENMSEEQLAAAGANESITHIDFMVGTSDLSIVGTTHDGREIPVFINGNFAF